MKKLMILFPNFQGGTLSPQVFGCVSYVHIHDQLHGKLDPRAVKIAFLGYSPTKKGYKCHHSPIKKHYITMNVIFIENQQYFNNTYFHEENISRLEDRWDWDVEKELKEGTNITIAEKNDIV